MVDLGAQEQIKERHAPIIYTMKEVSSLLHVSSGYVYDLVKSGLLPAIKLGSLKVRSEALEDFLKKYEGQDLSDVNNIKPLI